jgi:hypothetical protein
MIIVQKDSIILLDELQKNSSHDSQFSRLGNAEYFISHLLKDAFDYLIPVSAISKVLCFSEEDDRDFKGKRQLKEMLIQEAEYKNVQLLSLSEGRPSNDGSFISVQQLINSKKTESTAIQLDAVIAGIVILYYRRSLRLLNDDYEKQFRAKKQMMLTMKSEQRQMEFQHRLGDITAELNQFSLELVPVANSFSFYGGKEETLRKIRVLKKYAFAFMPAEKKEKFLSEISAALYVSCSADPISENWKSEVEALIKQEVKKQRQRLEWEFGIKPESDFFLSEQSGVQLLSYRGQDQEDTFTTEHGN